MEEILNFIDNRTDILMGYGNNSISRKVSSLSNFSDIRDIIDTEIRGFFKHFWVFGVKLSWQKNI